MANKVVDKLEKDVERDVITWCRRRRWSVEVYDAKGQYSEKAGRYIKNLGMAAGTPDIMGCDPEGTAVFIELKTDKKGKVLRLEQARFLLAKIDTNAFAVTVTSDVMLEEYYKTWIKMGKSKDYLKSILPKKVSINTRPPRVVDFSV